MQCRVCNHKTKEVFRTRIINKYDVGYFKCEQCDFLQTEYPFWLEEAYKEPINIYDTGIMTRNIRISEQTALFLYFLFGKTSVCLDHAGGYGIFTRLMRDYGFNFFWQDKYAKNLVSRGFEYREGMEIDLVSSFESFEHFVNPVDEIEKILQVAPNVLFSTELLPQPVPEPQKWPYYALEHGQHISFYSLRTLQCLSEHFGKRLYTFRDVHLFTEKPLNRNIFRFLMKNHGRYGLMKRVKKNMISKTLPDMILLQESNRLNQ